jgi:DNA-binding NarL/FixJ family response regulator
MDFAIGCERRFGRGLARRVSSSASHRMGRRRARAVPTAAPDSAAEGSAGLGLTVREREVLQLLANGRTNREIGAHLFITEKTAGIHVSNILGKVGAARRTEAVVIARRAGLV